jgi:hypothetical protein
LCHTAGAGLRRCRTWNWAWCGSRRLRSRRGPTWLDRGLYVGTVSWAARRRWRRARWSRLPIRAGDGWLHLRPIRWAARGKHRPCWFLWWCPARALGGNSSRWRRGRLRNRLCRRFRGGLRNRLCRQFRGGLRTTAEKSRDQSLLLRHASPRTSPGRQRGSCSPTRCRTR